jgi:nicotinate-nucleotide adenylyltransferase
VNRLCFGGSFNPIHHGHLICARAVAEARGYDRIELIPTAQPPHKPQDPALAPPEDRLKMCELATYQSSLLTVNDIELHLPRPSYTIDTARELRRRGFDKVHWLIGADMLLYLPKWRQPAELMAEVEFVILARPGWSFDFNQLPAEFRHLQRNVVETPLIDISSTQIRDRVSRGLDVEYLTPEAVCQYIRERGLYR